MKLKSFTASNMNAAMDRIRRELGEEAIIISSNRENNGNVRVIAAIDNDRAGKDSEAFTALSHKTISPKFQSQLAEVFKFHKIPLSITNKLLDQLTEDYKTIHEALESLLAANFKFQPLEFNEGKPLMVLGMPGIGKTLAVSKIFTQASFDNQKMHVITTDIKRAGGVEQLTAFTKILGVDLIIARTPHELKEELTRIKNGLIIIDTAGANPYDEFDLDGLKQLLEASKGEAILTIQAGGDVEEAVDIASAFKFTNARRLLITKADSARRFGSIFAALENNGLSFSNFSGTPNVGAGLEPVTPKVLASLLLKPIQ